MCGDPLGSLIDLNGNRNGHLPVPTRQQHTFPGQQVEILDFACVPRAGARGLCVGGAPSPLSYLVLFSEQPFPELASFKLSAW